MKITYIYHSCFLIEGKNASILIDYFDGTLPELKKPLYILSSHFHQDHFNSKIFSLDATSYILSTTIKNKSIPSQFIGKTTRINSNEKMKNEYFSLTTYPSTDAGVAFLIEMEGKRFYHAGDNNHWNWGGNDKEMEKAFLNNIKDIDNIDFAFFPVDPRLEGNAFDGIIEFYKKTKTMLIFPMHMWNNYGISEECNKLFKKMGFDAEIKIIDKELYQEEIL